METHGKNVSVSLLCYLFLPVLPFHLEIYVYPYLEFRIEVEIVHLIVCSDMTTMQNVSNFKLNQLLQLALLRIGIAL